jgi:hypothetical protein
LGKNQIFWSKVRIFGKKSDFLGKYPIFSDIMGKTRFLRKQSVFLGNNPLSWEKIKFFGIKFNVFPKKNLETNPIFGKKSNFLGKNPIYWKFRQI